MSQIHYIGNTGYSRLDDIAERVAAIASEIGPCWLIQLQDESYALSDVERGNIVGKLNGGEDARFVRALIDGEAQGR
jgi:hypothetical protein